MRLVGKIGRSSSRLEWHERGEIEKERSIEHKSASILGWEYSDLCCSPRWVNDSLLGTLADGTKSEV